MISEQVRAPECNLNFPLFSCYHSYVVVLRLVDSPGRVDRHLAHGVTLGPEGRDLGLVPLWRLHIVVVLIHHAGSVVGPVVFGLTPDPTRSPQTRSNTNLE